VERTTVPPPPQYKYRFVTWRDGPSEILAEEKCDVLCPACRAAWRDTLHDRRDT